MKFARAVKFDPTVGEPLTLRSAVGEDAVAVSSAVGDEAVAALRSCIGDLIHFLFVFFLATFYQRIGKDEKEVTSLSKAVRSPIILRRTNRYFL